MKTLDEILEYWHNPTDRNRPVWYFDGETKRSLMLVDIMKGFAKRTDSILEIGCNVGRNLAFLWRAGFENLSGVDINKKALDMMPLAYPELKEIQTFAGPVECIIRHLSKYDVIFTLATLEHIHPESVWIFEEIATRAGVLITIEDEKSSGERHFPRDYKEVFETLGLRQVYARKRLPGLSLSFRARVFRKEGGD